MPNWHPFPFPAAGIQMGVNVPITETIDLQLLLDTQYGVSKKLYFTGKLAIQLVL